VISFELASVGSGDRAAHRTLPAGVRRRRRAAAEPPPHPAYPGVPPAAVEAGRSSRRAAAAGAEAEGASAAWAGDRPPQHRGEGNQISSRSYTLLAYGLSSWVFYC
jgi:hypothetical protein